MTNKKTPAIYLDAGTLLKLFFKYPLSHFPVVENEEIYSFISKTNALRLSNDKGFSEANQDKQLKRLLYDLPLETFFEELEKTKIEALPIVSFLNKTITVTPTKQFKALHQNISLLSSKDYESLFSQIQIPFVIMNITKEILFKNSAFSQNFRHLLKKDILKNSIEKESLLKSIENKRPQKITLDIESIRHHFTIESLSLQGSSVFILYP